MGHEHPPRSQPNSELISTMLVALATAHRGDFVPALSFAKSFADVAPFPFLVGLLWIFARGPGGLSVDALLWRRRPVSD